MSEFPVVPRLGEKLNLGLALSPGAFRLLLAVAVLVSHISNLDIGRLAVLLFFFLSGYWTCRIWQEKFGEGSTLRFYLARYWRIAPLFFLMTFASALLRGQELGLTNFTLLGLAATGEATDPTIVSWSLDIELQFYLLLPLLMPLLIAAPWRTLAASIVVMAIGWQLDAQFAVLTLAKFLPAFVLGALTHLQRYKPSRRTANMSLLLFLAVTAATAATPVFWKTLPDPIDRDVYGLFWMLPLLPYVAHSLTIRSTPMDRHFGNLSFPLYLVHPALVFLVAQASLEGVPGKALVVAASLVVSVLIYVLIDRPIDKLRVRYTEGGVVKPHSAG